jgi:N6-adenosine-specific RNA methylase IME4
MHFKRSYDVSWPFGNLQRGKYAAILADPANRFKTWGGATAVTARGSKTKPATIHYCTMTSSEILALPVAELAAPNCVLFLWGSWPMLQNSLATIDAWGFTFKTCAFCWTKLDLRRSDPRPSMGMGYWTRANSEFCLLATRGKPKRLHADVRQAVIEPRREHSRKPDLYDRIERLVAGPYLELFARQLHDGWDSWGDECGKWP